MFRHVFAGGCVVVGWMLTSSALAAEPASSSTAFDFPNALPLAATGSRDEATTVFQLTLPSTNIRSPLVSSALFAPTAAIVPSAGPTMYSPLMGMRDGVHATPTTTQYNQFSLPYHTSGFSLSTSSVLQPIQMVPATSFDQRVNSLVPGSGDRAGAASGFQPASPLYQVR